MVPHPQLQASAHSSCGIARTALLLGLVCAAGLGAQDPTTDLIVNEIAPLLDSREPELRGEAALAVAATRDPRFYGPLLEVARDHEPAARQRGILALGYLQQPGTDVFLDRVLRDAPKDSLDRALAALALGLLPEEPRIPALDRFFSSARGSSMRRIRDRLVCLLLGLLREARPSRVTVLTAILGDASFRNHPLLALVIDNLARTPDRLDPEVLVSMLRASEPGTLAATLRALSKVRVEFDNATQKKLLRLCRKHSSTDVRVAALELLAVRRHPASLEIASELIDGADPVLAAAAIDTMLRLGGSTLRPALEHRILAVSREPVQAAMLRAMTAPHSDDFVAACLKIARDPRAIPARRASAAAIAAAAGWNQVTPVAVDLFLEAADPGEIGFLARVMRTLNADLRDKLYPARDVTAAERLSRRLGALLAAGHSQAPELVLHILKDPKADSPTRVGVLRAWRFANLTAPPHSALRLAPEGLRNLIR